MQKVEHIGIAVADIEKSKLLFSSLFNQEPYKEEIVESEGVKTVFFQMGETKIELLAATNENSVIHKFIAKKGEGIHHLAFAVNDIEAKIAEYQEKGYQLINPIPKSGADNKIIAFLHPKDTNGVLVELCQDKL